MGCAKGFKKIVSISLTGLLTVTMMGCWKKEAFVVEKSDIQFLETKEIGSPPDSIEVSGLLFHSSMAIESIENIEQGEVIHLLVKSSPVKEGRTGNLKYVVPITENTNMITIGKEKDVLWKRRE